MNENRSDDNESKLKNSSNILQSQSNDDNAFLSSVKKQLSQNQQLVRKIPFWVKLVFPLILLINLTQLNKIKLLNSYAISMDPYEIIQNKAWWRLLSYTLAIDSSGSGIRDIFLNLIIIPLMGIIGMKFYMKSHKFQYSIQQKDNKHNFEYSEKEINIQIELKSQISTNELSKSSIDSQVQVQNPTIQANNLTKPRINKFWALLIIQVCLVSIGLAIVNSCIWYIWTRFGPHTYVSIGVLPLLYYLLMKFLFLDKQVYQVNLIFLPFKVKSKIVGYLLGLFFLVFTNQAQACLLIMIFYFLFR